MTRKAVTIDGKRGSCLVAFRSMSGGHIPDRRRRPWRNSATRGCLRQEKLGDGVPLLRCNQREGQRESDGALQPVHDTSSGFRVCSHDIRHVQDWRRVDLAHACAARSWDPCALHIR